MHGPDSSNDPGKSDPRDRIAGEGPTPGDDTETPRVIGRGGALAVVAGSMLGIGIFLTPGIVASNLPSLGAYLLVWLLGGLIALAGASAYAELGALFPKAGGDYVFLREVFGSSMAFAAGWMLFIGIFVGSIATIAVPLCEYQLAQLFTPFDIDLSATWMMLPFGVPLTGSKVFAVGVVALLTAVNAVDTRLSTRTQLVLTMVPVAVLLVGALVAMGTRPAASMSVPDAGPVTIGGITAAVMAVYFAYSGWNAVGYVGGEVKDPERTIPFGLLAGTIGVTVLYGVLAYAFVHVLGMQALGSTIEAGTASASVIGGPRAQTIVTILIALALFGSLNGTILGGARIAYAMAKDRVLPTPLAHLQPRSHTPARALYLQATLASALIVTGTFELLLQLTSVAMLAMGAFTVVALFVLRRRSPDLHRPYRALGYPVLPALFVVASVLVIGVSIAALVSPPAEAELTAAERILPVFGLVVFAVAYGLHRLLSAGTPADAMVQESADAMAQEPAAE